MAGNPLTDPDWAAKTTEQVVRVVDNVKSKTTTPTVMAARGLVFGLLALCLGLFALGLFLIGLMRGIQAIIEPFSNQARAVYISYFIVGGILCIVGAVLFKKRNDGADAT
jgi:uncharacterized membrane protein YedE/YeeE